MNYIDLCACILIISGAFALICLGVLLIKASSTIKEATSLLQVLQITTDKANTTLDDINGKLDLLNAPVQTINGLFNKDKYHSGILSSILALKSMFKKKSK